MYNYINSSAVRLAMLMGYEIDEITYLIMENFLNTFMCRYDYEGIPEDCDKLTGYRNLQDLYIFFAPCIAWFEDKKHGPMYLPVSGMTEFNAVGKPKKWRVFSFNGIIDKELTDKESVLIFNDEALSIPYLHLLYEAKFMKKLDLAMNQNIDLQSTPYVIEAFEENKKQASTWSYLLQTFKSRIVLRKRKSEERNPLEASQVLNTDVEFKNPDFMKAYNEFLFRAHTYMGIKNVNIEKSERLLTGEISANDIIVQSNYTNGLDMRNKGFEQVNKMFGTNIKAKPTDLQTMVADMSSAYMAKGMGGGIDALHNVRDNPSKTDAKLST